MSEKKIQIKIGSRVYPITVSEDEEQVVLEASKLINKEISDLQGIYQNSKDAQDILSMTLLKTKVELLKTSVSEKALENVQDIEVDHTQEKTLLDKIELLIESAL